MKKALSSFVIICNSLNNGQDSISAFVPFMVRLFDIKDYSSVDVETICKDFVEEYGIQIPRHPIETILNRMRPQYLTKESGKIQIKKDEIKKSTQKIDLEKENRKYNALLENFIDFCNNYQISTKVSREEADILFTCFLKEHDLDIIFALYLEEPTSIIPDEIRIKDPDKIYLINRYVNQLLQKNDEYAEYLLDSAIGHKYASLILYREFSNLRGKGICANYYLDIGILFDLTGINKDFRKKAAEEFLSALREKGSKLWIFPHSREEFLRIIEGCLNWIENNYYDTTRASRALQYFKDLGYGVSEVQFFINQFQDVLDKNQIRIANKLDPNLDMEFQIGWDDLKNIILEVYNTNGHRFDVDDKEGTLERDIKSIENIYKLRKGYAPINLNETAHVFVTTNPGLAYASFKYEQIEYNRGYFTIPTVLTDTFVGTVLWIQEPTKFVKEFNRSKLISYTNAVLQPRSIIMTRFVQEIEKAKSNEITPISEESAIVLLSDGLVRKLLADKTMGDVNRITAQTPYEIIEELKAILVEKEKKKTEEAKKDSDKHLAEKIKAEEEKDKALLQRNTQTNHIISLIEKIAHWGKRGIVVILFALAIVFYASLGFLVNIPVYIKIINIILGVVSTVSGFTVLKLGEKVQSWIRKILINILLPNLNSTSLTHPSSNKQL